jgi:hypothetical protein
MMCHIIVATMHWLKIQILNCIQWNWKLVEIMSTCTVENESTSQL